MNKTGPLMKFTHRIHTYLRIPHSLSCAFYHLLLLIGVKILVSHEKHAHKRSDGPLKTCTSILI